MAALESAQYKQMIGRAGRAGIDSSGESILIVQHKDRDKVNKLIGGPMSKCVSSLNGDDGAGMRNFVLNLIGIKLCSSVQEVYDAISSTLFAKQSSNKEAVQLACDTSLSQLASKKLVVQKCNEDGETRLEVTDLGTAAYKGCIEVDIASVLYDDLCKAQLALSVQNYLHLIYLITPYSLVTQFSPDWSHMFNLHCKLSAEDLHVGNAVGVTERFLHRRTMNHGKVDPKEENIHRRFFVALMLYDLYREQPVWEVADKFHQNRAVSTTLLWKWSSSGAYHAIYGAFIKKFSLCAKPELNALMELPGVKIGKATLLYKAGFRSLQQIAYSEVSDLTNKVDYMTRSQARQIKATALMIIKEKSEALRAEADAVIALPTPVPDVSP
ncbi:HELQ [Bugula neritina]|uniref:HELQ n=1 Tax=Bugula neritina TaxID=10212 RepID=A0A7J7KFK0_BUGNE|nr:HELQ [Bugula neritina]